MCKKLNNRGNILFMRNDECPQQSWIIFNKAALLSQVNGVIFAPDDFNVLAKQSTLRPPEVHRLYVHFNVSSPFVLHVWGIMICITCGRSQKFSLKMKGYNF